MIINTLKQCKEELAKIHVVISRNAVGDWSIHHRSHKINVVSSDPQFIYDAGVSHRQEIIKMLNEQARAQEELRKQKAIQRRQDSIDRRDTNVAARRTLVQTSRTIVECSSESMGSEAHSFFCSAINNMESAEKEIEEFAVSVQADPCYAMDWSSSAFKAAARMAVSQEILTALCFNQANEGGVSALELKKTLVEDFTSRVISAASSTSCSTSQSTNMMEREKLAVMAEACRRNCW